ncbi:MAG: MoxR family ATPase [Microscillaceae bacterium]
MPADLAQEIMHLQEKLHALRKEIHKKIVGQEAALDQLLISLLAGGHSLLEGAPGLAKTLMVRSLAEAIALPFRRIQFTPDLMPSDITGTQILAEDPQTGHRQFQFSPGPLFANIVLADEINRTPPKTQAALLEAMQEFSVSYGGETHLLPRPFFLLATQNPIEQSGTFPLPEAQLDRFLLYIQIDYPSEAEELAVLTQTTGAAATPIEAVMQGEDILRLQTLVREVVVSEALIRQVNRLVRATRPQNPEAPDFVKKWVSWGAGPRAGQALLLTAKARAFLKGRLAVVPEDLHALTAPVLRHRVLLNFSAEAEGYPMSRLLDQLQKQIPWDKA